MKKLFLPLVLMILLSYAASGCGTEPAPTAVPMAPTATPAATSAVPPAPTNTPVVTVAPFTLSSSAFETGGEIAELYSCFGENLSPPLEWAGGPAGTQSLVLLVDDPDSEPPGFVHWVVYNITPTATGLPEGVPPGPTLEDGSLQGSNDFAPFGSGMFPGGSEINGVGYDGPCPGGEHRYVFVLYALDTTLDLPAEPAADQVRTAMEGHVLDQAELIGLYAPPE